MNNLETEKKVLATILTVALIYKKLPPTFSAKCFKTPLYSRIFEIVDQDYIKKGKYINMFEIRDKYPDLSEDIFSVCSGVKTLDENFSSKAEELIPHPDRFKTNTDEIIHEKDLSMKDGFVDGPNAVSSDDGEIVKKKIPRFQSFEAYADELIRKMEHSGKDGSVVGSTLKASNGKEDVEKPVDPPRRFESCTDKEKLIKNLQTEKEVLATILLVPNIYKKLPLNFSWGCFQKHEYALIFAHVELDFIQKGKRVNYWALAAEHPELRSDIISVTSGMKPLCENFKSKAEQLIPRLINCEEYADELLRKWGLTDPEESVDGLNSEASNGMEILKKKIPEQEFLIDKLINKPSLTFIVGETGCGKTWLAMNLATSVAVGAERFLSYKIKQKAKVLYVNTELNSRDFERRLQSVWSSLAEKGELVNFIASTIRTDMDFWETVYKDCEEHRPSVLITDCHYLAHGKSENNGTHMEEEMNKYQSLMEKFNLAIILIHHPIKGARYEQMHNDQLIGSSILSRRPDTIIQMRFSCTDKEKIIFKPTKFRHVPEAEKKCRLLSLNQDTHWFSDEGETDESEHIGRHAREAREEIDFRQIFQDKEEMSRKEILEKCEPLGYNERTIDRMIRKAKDRGILKVPRYGFFSL